MRTRIISAFPGTGKSHYHKKHPITTLDSDSIKFSWVDKEGKKERNPDFPNNYIKHIKENIGKYEFIFVSSHKEVRKALLDNCIFFYLIYPSYKSKESYIKRYIDRGSPDAFIELLNANFDTWIKECSFEEYGCSNISMNCCKYLDKELLHIIRSENGNSL